MEEQGPAELTSEQLSDEEPAKETSRAPWQVLPGLRDDDEQATAELEVEATTSEASTPVASDQAEATAAEAETAAETAEEEETETETGPEIEEDEDVILVFYRGQTIFALSMPGCKTLEYFFACAWGSLAFNSDDYDVYTVKHDGARLPIVVGDDIHATFNDWAVIFVRKAVPIDELYVCDCFVILME